MNRVRLRSAVRLPSVRLPGYRPNPIRAAGQILAVVLPALVLLVDIPGLEPPGQRMLAIFVAAVVLWVTEAIPLVATAVLVILLQVLLISDQAILPVGEDAPTAASVYAALANPVIILFLGGFLLADGAAKFGLDKNLAAIMLRPFAGSVRSTVLGLMLITAALSAFMSNTATTATMLAVLVPVLAVAPTARMRIGLALSIPVAANVGGVITPIGSPPNAIALAALTGEGHRITFLEWVVATAPLVVVLLALSWLLLVWRYLPAREQIPIDLHTDFDVRPKAVLYYVIAAVTVVGWFTEPLHGIPASTVAFVPVVVLLATSVMTGDDLRVLQWPVLWLVAGGIALGAGVGTTGLDEWMVGLVDWARLPELALFAGLLALSLALGTLISNSATANLLIPLTLGLAVAVGGDAVMMIVGLAIVCGLGMALPVSTPPNAIAYATGEFTTKDMATIGLGIGVVALVLTTLVMPLWWQVVGLI